MNPSKTEKQDEWPRGWEESELIGLCHVARLPMSVKLEWLEEASRMVEHMQRNRAKREIASNEERNLRHE